MSGPEVGEPRLLTAPEDTRGWTPVREPEGWRDTQGNVWVRARGDEAPEIIVQFPRHGGVPNMRLIRASESSTVKRATKKARREQRELEKRGIEL